MTTHKTWTPRARCTRCMWFLRLDSEFYMQFNCSETLFVSCANLAFSRYLGCFSSHHTIWPLSAIPLAVWVVWECLFSVPTDSIYLRNLQTGVHELISGNSWSLWVVCPFNVRRSSEGWSVTFLFKAVCALASFLPRWNLLSQRKLLQNVGGDCTLVSWLFRAK